MAGKRLLYGKMNAVDWTEFSNVIRSVGQLPIENNDYTIIIIIKRTAIKQ